LELSRIGTWEENAWSVWKSLDSTVNGGSKNIGRKKKKDNIFRRGGGWGGRVRAEIRDPRN